MHTDTYVCLVSLVCDGFKSFCQIYNTSLSPDQVEVLSHLFSVVFRCYSRFTSAVVYQGLVMRLGIIGGNLYIDFFISGVVELPGALLILLTIERFGRRLPFAASNVVAGVACLVTAFLPEGNCPSNLLGSQDLEKNLKIIKNGGLLIFSKCPLASTS